MVDSKQEKNQRNNFLHSAVIALAGTVVGLGIAAVGLVLRKEKNREKIKDSLSGAKDHVVGFMEDKNKDIKDTVNKLEEEHDKNKEKLQKIVDLSKES